jgi:hypothetical protein
MAKLIYAAITSLDGYIEGAEGRAANTPALKRGLRLSRRHKMLICRHF